MTQTTYDKHGKQFLANVNADGSVSDALHLQSGAGNTARVSASFARPNDSTAYASGDLVANSTTAGSVAAMSFAVSRVTGLGGMIRRVRLRKTGTGIVGASFRLHLYSAAPTPSNGDNAAWLTDQAANYIGALDVTVDRVFSDGAAGNGVPVAGGEINFTSDTVYGLLEARGAYAPTAQETITLSLEILQN